MRGTVVAIFTAPAKGAPIVARDEVEAVAGRGLVGDRNFEATRGAHDPEDEITLIASEGLELARTERGLDLDPGEHRRNVVTTGLDLLALVDRTITVGEAEVEVMEDNPPCRYLQDLTGKPVVTGLHGEGGVRGRIVSDGVIRVGDPVTVVSAVESVLD
ncbi:MAG: MOSC domain-containing protein [Acidimicrobiales bacterium]